jgi:hypothetical protein
MGRSMRSPAFVILLLLLTACSSTVDDASSARSSEPAVSDPARSEAPSIDPTAEPTPEPTATPIAEPSESQAPRALIGIWRTTLGGQPLSLSITETSYRIVRGGNTASGSVLITDDVIEFFDSDLCPGSGVYRWSITDGALSFSPLQSEPCTGRAEAVLVRYTDYSPPSGG